MSAINEMIILKGGTKTLGMDGFLEKCVGMFTPRKIKADNGLDPFRRVLNTDTPS